MSQPSRLFNRNFILLWQGLGVSELGSQAYSIALILWVREATGSATLVGTIMMVGGLTAFASLLGGTLADRHSRKGLIVLFDLVRGALLVVLAALFFAFPGDVPLLIVSLFVVNVLRGVCGSLFTPAVTALVPDLVPPDRLTAANSWIQSTFRVVGSLGNAVGGVAFRVLGAPLLFLIDGITYLLSGLSECFIREPREARPEPPTSRERSARSFLEETREGLRYVWGRPGMRIYFGTAAVGNFVIEGMLILLPFLVADHLGARVDWYGYLLAGFAVAALLGTAVAGATAVTGRTRSATMIVAVFALFLGFALLGVAPNRFVAMGLLLASGLAAGFYGVHITTVLQSQAPGALRGRVLGLQSLFRFGLAPLGMGFFGLLADLTGGRIPWIYLGSGLFLLVVNSSSFSQLL